MATLYLMLAIYFLNQNYNIIFITDTLLNNENKKKRKNINNLLLYYLKKKEETTDSCQFCNNSSADGINVVVYNNNF